MKEEKVILVDREDNSVGTLPKMEAHEKGVLHRAFSVFILNQKGELMLQQRALHKYHSPGLWTNTCCSHQREGEENLQAGTRRLEEEMGFSVPLEELFSFIYKAPFDNGLTEHELDHVMLGYYEGIPEINSDEVNAWKWMSLNEIASDLTVNPESYTVWFKIIFERFFNHIKSTK
jgi:isopentenyl-diphosphate delta-isomerase